MRRKILLAHMVPAAAVLLAMAVQPSPVSAQATRGEIEAIVKQYLAQHPEEIGDMVKDYLAKHPEALQQALIEMMKKRTGAGEQTASARPAAPDKSALIHDNANMLFGSSRQVTLGNAQGDVTLVEFFDYNCGYCRRALSDTVTLLKDDPKLRIVLKEFPILGPGSVEAAKIGVAVRMQDPTGKKYLAFHQKLLGGRGPANRDTALAAAREAGIDMARLEADGTSDEIAKTLDETRRLGQTLGINGTPGYVVGTMIVPGAIGAEGLKRVILQARN
ncbi:Protein-disulfide isomerase [Rhizobiales bacterium GAS191]|jgi:protein-disulfide isomerase|nr:Protein-disulfide isomerase [Rhizobiales bacterium GAS113]SEE20326.1 Protein-disulfide isomerase [Rhizobiales bacterium GAS191]SEE35539.1 Protein-disulfide isomerase [Rhizobiales bacterium GAS188]